MTRTWPLVNQFPDVLVAPSPGAFSAARKHDVHTGIDLYAPVGTKVVAIEEGIVVNVEIFTGPRTDPPLPHWHETFAVLVEGESGVLLYGEIEPAEGIMVGKHVMPGDLLGTVLQVLKPRPGKVFKNPPSMLHFEQYDRSFRVRNGVVWNLDQPRPEGLLDPTGLLQSVRPANKPITTVEFTQPNA